MLEAVYRRPEPDRQPIPSTTCPPGHPAHEMAKPNFRDKTLYGGFEWTSTDPAVAKKAYEYLLEQRLLSAGRKAAVLWSGLTRLDYGVFLPWVKPGTYQQGYGWYQRTIGHLVRLGFGTRTSWTL